MNYRMATPDDAPLLAPLLMEAMSEVFYLYLQKEDKALALHCVEQCLRAPDNLYSYQNALVLEADNHLLGIVLAYDGAHFIRLRHNSLPHFHYPSALIPHLETETEAGEFYIDALAIAPIARGKGLGKSLLKAAIHHAEQQGAQRVALLVSPDKTGAKHLYAQLGFSPLGEKRLGKELYEHWVRDLNHV